MEERPHRFYHGQSMAGTFRPGDRLHLRPASLAQVRRGDVVVYQAPQAWGGPEHLVHRVVAIGPDGLVVQGDNNPAPDGIPVTEANLAGLVTHAERKGSVRPVVGGALGLWRARLLRLARQSSHYTLLLCAKAGSRPYRWLRKSGLISRLWHPRITQIRLQTARGSLVKYSCAGRTVARHWPEIGRFECLKPFDLVIPRPDGGTEQDACRGCPNGQGEA